jgi:hypothetical protein
MLEVGGGGSSGEVTVNAVTERLIDIVRDLADEEPIAWSDDGEWHRCALCDASLVTKPGDHEATCPWRRARAWVDAQGMGDPARRG